MSSKPGAGHANSFHDWFFFVNRHKASVSKQQVWEPGTKPIEVSAQCQNSEAELEPSALSPEIAISEAGFERELEEEVTIINATKDEAVLRTVTASS
jgi:hypothetical protein